MDHLREAERRINQSNNVDDVEWAQLDAQQAIAHALISLVKGLKRLEVLLEKKVQDE